MARCDDTGAVYALQAERYYDAQDDEEARACGECEWWEEKEQCPCGCGYACCTWAGKLKHFEADACPQFTPRISGAAQ